MDANGSNRRQLTHDPLALTLMWNSPSVVARRFEDRYRLTMPDGGLESSVVLVSDGVDVRHP